MTRDHTHVLQETIKAIVAALTRISQNCKQFIKFECNKGVGFVQESVAWWTSRDGMKMNYWGGAGGSANMCACGSEISRRADVSFPVFTRP